MSGGVKSGLIFALASLLLITGVGFIPAFGAVCCGPVLGLGLGAAAGYFGVAWTPEARGVGQGVLAGLIAGAGMLVAALISSIVGFAAISQTPEFRQAFEQQLSESPNNFTPQQVADINAMLPFFGVGVGMCTGIIYLLLGLGLGAFGGWLATRRRQGGPPSYQPPFASPPPTSTF